MGSHVGAGDNQGKLFSIERIKIIKRRRDALTGHFLYNEVLKAITKSRVNQNIYRNYNKNYVELKRLDVNRVRGESP